MSKYQVIYLKFLTALDIRKQIMTFERNRVSDKGLFMTHYLASNDELIKKFPNNFFAESCLLLFQKTIIASEHKCI